MKSTNENAGVQGEIAAEIEDRKLPFIPSWLDDSELSHLAFRVFCSICRRDPFWESKTKLEKRLRASNRSIKAAFDELLDAGLVIEMERTGTSSVFRPSAKQHHPTNSTTSPCPPAPSPSAIRHHKGNSPKETPLRKSSYEVSKEGIDFAEWFRGLLPDGVTPPPKWKQAYAKAHDDLVRLDGRTPEEIRRVSQWARSDPFWCGNFMSPAKLRKRNPDGITYFDVFSQKMKPTQPIPKPDLMGLRRLSVTKINQANEA